MVRYLADASLHQGIVMGCRRREPALDFLSANEAKLEGVSDPKVLSIAGQQNRILVTSGLRTMPHHFAAFLEQYKFCPGNFLDHHFGDLDAAGSGFVECRIDNFDLTDRCMSVTSSRRSRTSPKRDWGAPRLLVHARIFTSCAKPRPI